MSNYFDLNGGGNYFDLAVGNYFDLDGGGNYFDFEEIIPDAPFNIIPPTVNGLFSISGVLTLNDGDWTDGTLSYQWRKADDVYGTNAANVSGETSLNYTIPSGTFSVGDAIGARVTSTNIYGSTNADTDWYEIMPIRDVYYFDNYQHYGPTIFGGRSTTRRESHRENISNFSLDRYEDRLDDLNYYHEGP